MACCPTKRHSEPAAFRSRRTIITLGAGVQLLSLPDINFTFFVKNGDAAVRTQKNSDLDDYGGAFVDSIETPLGYWGATPVTGVISGFFANVTDTDRTRCKSTGSLSCYNRAHRRPAGSPRQHRL
jgi:hypothetical protein